jgi:hypothetical protein
MPITLSCPSCRAPVEAADADRGKTIHCGVCWAEVTVPGVPAAPVARLLPTASAVPAPPPAPPADPLSKASPALKATPVPPAVGGEASGAAGSTDGLDSVVIEDQPPAGQPAVPVAKAIPVARARVATVCAVPATAKPLSAESKGGSGSKPRSRSRDERGEEGDDGDRPRRVAKSGGVLIIVLLIGGFLLVGLAGVGVVGYYLLNSKPDVAGDPDPNPLIGPKQGTAKGGAQPPIVAPLLPNNQADVWVALPGADGFTASLPKAAESVSGPASLDLPDGEAAWGNAYTARYPDARIRFALEYYDVPAGVDLDITDLVKRRPDGDRLPPRWTVVWMGAHSAREWKYRESGAAVTLRACRSGPRLFVFGAWVEDPPSGGRTRDAEAVRAKFFDSIRVTFRAGTPPPPGRARPKDPPGFPPPADVPGALKSVARVEPFAVAVALPGKGEVLTFAVRNPGPKPGGLVRRYSAATWKLLGTAELPSPVLCAAADEKAGRLYVGTAARNVVAPDARDARDRLTAVGDFQAFDLKAVLADDPPQGELKPLATARFADSNPGVKVAGLEVDPKGRAVYVATVAMLPKGKVRTRVWKLNPSDLTAAGADLDLPQPVGGLRLSPDGKWLFAAEFPYNSFGQPSEASGPSAVHLIDAGEWKKDRAVQLPGTVAALAFVENAKAAAVLAVGAQQVRLFTVAADGATADVTPSPALRVPGAGFAAFAGGKLVLSAKNAAGTEVLALGGTGAAKSVGRAVATQGGLVNGPVTVTPDGKFAFYGSGVVLDLAVADKAGAD